MTPLLLSLLAAPQVDVALNVIDPTVNVGCTAEIEILLTAATPTEVAGVDAILSWDPNQLTLIEAVEDPQWFVAAFLDDPDGINDDVTDGEAIFTALSSPSTPVLVGGTQKVATLRFHVQGSDVVSLVPSMGAVAETIVVGTTPGVPVTGALLGPAFVTGIDVPAVEAIRLGFPPNPNVLLPGQTSGPIIEQVWDPVIDHTTFLPGALLDTIVLTLDTGGPPINIPSPYGTILVDLGAMPLIQQFGAPGQPFPIPVPKICSLVGTPFRVQGASVSMTDIQATNALDIVVGTF